MFKIYKVFKLSLQDIVNLFFSLAGNPSSYACGDNTYKIEPYGNYNSQSQFYVFVGVMAFLYCIATLILYVWFDDKFRNIEKIPIVVSKSLIIVYYASTLFMTWWKHI